MQPPFASRTSCACRWPAGSARWPGRSSACSVPRSGWPRVTPDRFLVSLAALSPHGGDVRGTRRELPATGEKVRRRREVARAQPTPQEEEIALPGPGRRTNLKIGAQLFIGARTAEWAPAQGVRQARHQLPARARRGAAAPHSPVPLLDSLLAPVRADRAIIGGTS